MTGMAVSPPTAVGSLEDVVRNYCMLASRLRRTLNDTRLVFNEINSAKCFIGNQPITGELGLVEEREIESVATQPPCFVVVGATMHARTVVVNRLFQREVVQALAPPAESERRARWRTILFRYSTKNRLTRLDDHTHVGPPTPKKSKAWVSVNLSEVQIDDLSIDDPPREGEGGSGGESGGGTLDVQFKHPLLEAGARVMVMCAGEGMRAHERAYQTCTRGVSPIIIYAIADVLFSDQELDWLRFMRSKALDMSIFFVRVPSPLLSISPLPTASAAVTTNGCVVAPPQLNGGDCADSSLDLLKQLADLGVPCSVPGDWCEGACPLLTSPSSVCLDVDSDSYSAESELLESFESFPSIAPFMQATLQRRLVSAVSLANVVHVRCLEMMIARAYDMQWDVMGTPKRLSFAKEKEEELFRSLMDIIRTKQDEIKRMIAETIAAMKDELVNKAAQHQFRDIVIPENGEITSAKELQQCTVQIQDLVLASLNTAVGCKLLSSVDVLRDCYTGVLTRCLHSLEQRDLDQSEPLGTSKALAEILNAAYQVEITVSTGESFVKTVIMKMKQLMQSVLWRSAPCVDSEWKRRVASNMLATLTEPRCQRLARSICAQIQDRLRRSHATFELNLRQLEQRHTGRLERTVEQRERVAKRYAPRVARLSLESRSLRDLIAYGKPRMGQEVGRGQYGIVYSCEAWGGYGPCAVKSVVPQDEKHWNDLAMEFYYYKNIPEHERVVALRGSVIIDHYTGGGQPAALLVMDRLKWDLYSAIEKKLPWPSRLQVAVDVVEGIRFLHNQGLVHRDVKLKNVLLDDNNRGKLTDLGFCKPEAMISGSVVGTPIHMAPELFSGRYDHSVDVYAFGILFWYICAGAVRLPRSFEVCPSKEALWRHVESGLRPEKPLNCDDDCYELMSNCWHGDAAKRPLVGEVEIALRKILDRFPPPVVVATATRDSSLAGTPDRNESDSDTDGVEL